MSRDPFTHRKADVRLQILNPDGTPAIRKSVRADQVSHRFLFGCGAFDTVDLMKTQDAGDRAFLQERMEKWLALFNYGTLPFYWGRYEPIRRLSRRQPGCMKKASGLRAIPCAGTPPARHG